MQPATPPSRDATDLKGQRGFVRLVRALAYSRDGLAAAWRHEDAFRQEAVLACVLIPVALVLPVGLVERILLVGVVLLVLIVELLNTAVEAAMDRHGPELNPLAKRAKDCGSAAVLFALLLAGGTWVAILAARFWP